MSQGLENIIVKSSKLLMKQGYSNTSMADIGKSCKLNKGSIYHYFSSKEDLVRAVVNDLSDKFEELVFSCAYDGRYSEKKRLNMMLKRIEEYFVSSKGCLMWQLASELVHANPQIIKSINNFFDLWVNAFMYILESQYTKRQARELAIDSIVQIEGAVIWLRIRNDSAPLKRVLNGLKSRID